MKPSRSSLRDMLSGTTVGSIQIAVGLTVESPFFLQAVIQGRRGDCVQLPDQRVGDTCVVDEARDGLEGRDVVMVEADDHAAQNVEAMGVDAADALDQRTSLWPHVLQLFGLD